MSKKRQADYRARQKEGQVTLSYTGSDVRIEHALRPWLDPMREPTRAELQRAWKRFINFILGVTDGNPIP
jgi:hypothetical protein